MKCHKCNAEYTVSQGRVPFRARCAGCDSPLHVCLQCALYDPAAYNSCRESAAERVVEKARENRCEYFRPGDGGLQTDLKKESAKKALDDLFG